ncbi:hypothetical protein [Pedobacter sp. NJ-S-72]
MGQSLYTEISKSLGTEGKPIDLPDLEEAQRLYKKVTVDHHIPAFRWVFSYYRFGKSPETFAEKEVTELINEAYTIGAKYFRTPLKNIL